MSSILTAAARYNLKQYLRSNPAALVSRRFNSTQGESAFKRFLHRPVRMDEFVFAFGAVSGGMYFGLHELDAYMKQEFERLSAKSDAADEALCLSERIQQLEMLKIGGITQEEYVQWLKKNLEKRKKLLEGAKRVELKVK